MPTLIHKHALSFNDVLLVPQHNCVKSRLDVDLSTRLTRNINIKHPILSTNMSTITEFEMIKTMWDSGSAGLLHRFQSEHEILRIIRKAKKEGIYPIVISVGTNEFDYSLVDNCLSNTDTTPNVFLIDIAHGDSSYCYDMIKYIKSNFSEIDVIAGNICTKEAAIRMGDMVDAIRVGVGGSKVCSTRTTTSHGMPLLQSIIDCKEGLDQIDCDIPIIADGGISTSGGIAVALAFGASSCSLGTLLAATSDTPGDIIETKDGLCKRFTGMSSKQAAEIRRGGLKPGTAPEGISIMEPYKGDTKDVLEELLGGIRSALTYSGAYDFQQLRDNSQYVILSYGSMLESKFI